MLEGFHVPVTPLLDVRGSAGAELFKHKGPIGLNKEGSSGVTCIFNVRGGPGHPSALVSIT